jgi:hypothetical protein
MQLPWFPFTSALLLLSSTAQAERDTVLEASSSFEVPSFDSRQLVFQGQDLFAVTGDKWGASGVQGDIALIYTQTTQTPNRSLSSGR